MTVKMSTVGLSLLFYVLMYQSLYLRDTDVGGLVSFGHTVFGFVAASPYMFYLLLNYVSGYVTKILV